MLQRRLCPPRPQTLCIALLYMLTLTICLSSLLLFVYAPLLTAVSGNISFPNTPGISGVVSHNACLPDTSGNIGGTSNSAHLLAGPGVSGVSATSAFVASTVPRVSHEPYYAAPVQYDRRDGGMPG